MENLSDDPVPVLTQDHKMELKGTEVMEIYKKVQLPGAQKLNVNLKTIDEESKVQMISLSESAEDGIEEAGRAAEASVGRLWRSLRILQLFLTLYDQRWGFPDLL